MTPIKYLSIILLTFIASIAFGQNSLAGDEICATMQMHQQALQADQNLQQRMLQLENFTNSLINDSLAIIDGIITIPVAVHVVYNPATPAQNISDAQILSQIDVLNEDFRATNSYISQIVPEFQSRVADYELEFCLATITRTKTTKTVFSDNSVKFTSQGGRDAWDATKYMNMWVCDIDGSIIGWAQFPGGNLATDGIVMDYRFTGRTGVVAPPYQYGHTCTHEVGHWLNLRHIWADESTCNFDDLVDDTPVQDTRNFACPGGLTKVSCGGLNMTQNYMDYTTDECKGAFTVGQKARSSALFVSGGFRASLITSVCPSGVLNVPPSVNITSPANNVVFGVPANATINATATDSDGSVTKVEFYDGATLISTDNSAPYSATWSSSAIGVHRIIAKAFDDDNEWNSMEIIVNVNTGTNQPPVTNITDPANGATFTFPSTFLFQANASDPDGSISNVEFYVDNVFQIADVTSPYAVLLGAVQPGTHTLTVKAIDNLGAATTSLPITITMGGSNLPPTCTMVSPTNGATFTAPAVITVQANASDSDGTITRVDFYENGNVVAIDAVAPYFYQTLSLPAGTYTFQAKAFDNAGATTFSNIITVTVTTVGNQPPVVNISSPANGASFTAPANTNVTANASDPDGSISKVEFYANNMLFATDIVSPYTVGWTNVQAGNYALTAKAFDNNNATTTSAAVNVIVTGANPPPTVSITSPANGASFTAPANITINANASDANGINRVEFYRNGVLLNTDATSPYAHTMTNVAAGNYALTAKAFDNLGANTTSSVVNITVGTGANQPPVVSVTSPSNNQNFTFPSNVTLQANATDADGTINKVELYLNNILFFTFTSSPYRALWYNVPPGNYTLKAKAFDNAGANTTSSVISFVVSNPSNLPPVVNMVHPTNGSNFNAPAIITFYATAYDSDGSINKVEFYNANTLLTIDNTSPYFYTWTNIPAGTYNVSAKAFDNNNASTTSNVTFTVSTVATNQPPTVSITSPSNGASFTAPANITINASANDSDGTINKVEFYRGTTLLGIDVSAPYSFNMSNTGVGTYNLTAKAFDNNNASTTSTAVNITVTQNTGNLPPTVNILNSDTTVRTGSILYISAIASDPDGTVARVDWYFNNGFLFSSSSGHAFTMHTEIPGVHTIRAKAVDNLGASSSFDQFTLTIVGSAKTGGENRFVLDEKPSTKIFPNPSNGIFNIQSAFDFTMDVFDIYGKAIFKNQHMTQLDLSDYEAGIYIVRIKYLTGIVETKKINLVK